MLETVSCRFCYNNSSFSAVVTCSIHSAACLRAVPAGAATYPGTRAKRDSKSRQIVCLFVCSCCC